MNTRKIYQYLNNSLVTFGVTTVCGLIGTIEGAISGSIGATIVSAAESTNHLIKNTAMVSSIGIGSLGAVEGLILGVLAINGFFGTAQDMEKNGYKKLPKRILGYVGYTANQILGGITAGLLLKFANILNFTEFSLSFNQLVSDVAVGAAISGIVITPIVTALTVMILSAAFSATKSMDSDSTLTYERIQP